MTSTDFGATRATVSGLRAGAVFVSESRLFDGDRDPDPETATARTGQGCSGIVTGYRYEVHLAVVVDLLDAHDDQNRLPRPHVRRDRPKSSSSPADISETLARIRYRPGRRTSSTASAASKILDVVAGEAHKASKQTCEIVIKARNVHAGAVREETTMPMQRLDARQADAAAATLGEAFFDDPVLLIVAPDEATRRRWGSWFMSLPLQYGLRWGEVWGTEDVSAVAVWVPPGSGEMGLGRMLRVGVARMPFRLGMGGSRRFMQALSATEPFHKAVHGPHWYLVAVGTRSECQGQGLGSALVEVGTSRGRRGRGAVLSRDRDAVEHRLLHEARVRNRGPGRLRRPHAYRHGPPAK